MEACSGNIIRLPNVYLLISYWQHIMAILCQNIIYWLQDTLPYSARIHYILSNNLWNINAQLDRRAACHLTCPLSDRIGMTATIAFDTSLLLTYLEKYQLSINFHWHKSVISKLYRPTRCIQHPKRQRKNMLTSVYFNANKYKNESN